MPNVTKRDIVLDIARSTGFTQTQIRGVVDEFFTIVAKELQADKKIELRGFGTFYTKDRKPRLARNPKTGEPVQLEKTRAPLLKFSSDIKDKINTTIELPTEERIHSSI
ncbi:MAG: HU family DNA-binding protein [Fibrobacterales bacterium]